MLNSISSRNPAISAIMSVYNGEDYLAESIESILNQTYRDFEFIIIDDGSSDNTASIIDTYASKDSRIKVIHQKNHGLVYSLNRGCKEASGEFIARMDADDISLPSRFESQIQALSSHPNLSIVGTYFSYVDEGSRILDTAIVMPTKDIDIRRALYVVNPFAHGSVMFKRSVWNELGGYTDSYGPTEDYELWRRLADDERNKMEIVPQILYLYRINPQGISKQKADIQAKFTKQIVDEQWQKTYLGKSIRAIINDGKYYYRLVGYPLDDNLFGTYYHQQILIMSRLFLDRHFLTGTKQAIAIFIMRPRHHKLLLVRSVAGGFLRKIGVKK